MITVKVFTTLFILSILAIPISGNVDKKYGIDKKKIDSFLSELEKNKFNGAVLVSDGKSTFSKCYGFADKQAGLKCDSETVFDVGSITKQFTGAAILKLEMQGKLRVEDKITKYFKNVPADKQGISIHHLLTHSAGFPGGLGNDYDVVGRNDYVARAFKTPLRFKVGSKYEYSNVGFSIAAAIVEIASGLRYEEFLNKYLFTPSGMTKTGYLIPKWTNKNIAVGYRGGKRWGRPTEKKWGKHAPSWHLVGNGGILSTVGDMYKWHQALEGEKILGTKEKAKLYKRHIEEGEGSGTYYGYGWAIFPTSRNTWMVAHNGGNGVFFADLWRYTKEGVTIIMMTNEANRNWERIPQEISKSIFRDNYTPKLEIKKKEKISSLSEHPSAKTIKGFIKAVISQEAAAISKFAKDNFSEGFLQIAPMKKHIELLSELGSEIKGEKITGISMQGNRTMIEFGNGKIELSMRVIKGKISGVGF